LISLRVAIESFGATMAGLVLSSYFAGFTLAALRCGPIIERVGHIRAYAAFAGMVVAAIEPRFQTQTDTLAEVRGFLGPS
jgi:MFS family permease